MNRRLKPSRKNLRFAVRMIVLAIIIGFLWLAVDKPEGLTPLNFTERALKDICLGAHNYAANDGSLPAQSAKGLSWRFTLLSYLEQGALHAKFDPEQPWDGPENLHLLKPTPETLTAGNITEPEYEEGLTNFQAITGPGTAWERPGMKIPDDFPDGLEFTILIAEAEQLVQWSKPADMVYDPGGPLPRFGNRSKVEHSIFGSHNYGFGAAFADGSVRFFSKKVDKNVLRALITRNGGEQILDE